MKAAGPLAFFLPMADGQRYCIYHAAHGVVRGVVLQAAPFAEELNKTRRMAALQARALASAGYAVLQIDLLGCGDSSGDFGHARWSLWIQDLLQARKWLADTDAAHHGLPLWIWGIRAGCLLAADTARLLNEPCHLLFWQPSFTEGVMQLQQFLRLRLAADMLSAPDGAGRARGAMDALRRQLADGETLHVAGYALHPELAAELHASRLAPPAVRGVTQRLVWLEVASAAQAGLSPVGKRTLLEWQQAGWRTEGLTIQGPAFWQSSEIKEAPALLVATLTALTRSVAEPAPS